MQTPLVLYLLRGRLATFVVFGGADIGVGILHLIVGGDDEQRWHSTIRAIRPVWKPNEVWLVASGGDHVRRLSANCSRLP